MSNDKLIESLNLINNKLNTINIDDNNKILKKSDNSFLEKFEDINNEIKDIKSNINYYNNDFACKKKINPYIIIVLLYIMFIIFTIFELNNIL
jgi:archaellum component FlaC